MGKPSKNKPKQTGSEEELILPAEGTVDPADTFFDFETFARLNLKIKNKAGEIIPLILNKSQKRAWGVIKKLIAEGKPVRVITLKARQMGFSTLFDAVTFWLSITNFNIKALIVGHIAKASSNLFDMTRRFYDHLPFKPQTDYASVKKLSFAELKSEIGVETAEGRGSVGRSGTLQILHLTELAWYADAKSVLVALLQSVPRIANTMVFIESTANGVGGSFHEIWEAALKGENEWTPLFFPWHEEETYNVPFDNEEMKKRFSESLEQDEVEAQKLYNLTLEQLQWRRLMIANECGGDKLLFMQEYPASSIEAFIATGRPVLNIEVVRRHNERTVDSPYLRGNLEYLRDKLMNITGIKFVPDQKGNIYIYHDIETTKEDRLRFCAGSDVAEGLEQGDYSTISVWDRKYKRVCLEWFGHIDADLFAQEQWKIKMFLGECFFCTERNNHGLTTIVGAFKLGVPLYSEQEFDGGVPKDTDKLGYRTDSRDNKDWIIDLLKERVREDSMNSNSHIFWYQAMRFVYNAKGRASAQGKDRDPSIKSYDDMVMAYALMLECDRWLPPYKHIVPIKKREQKTGRRKISFKGERKELTFSSY